MGKLFLVQDGQDIGLVFGAVDAAQQTQLAVVVFRQASVMAGRQELRTNGAGLLQEQAKPDRPVAV